MNVSDLGHRDAFHTPRRHGTRKNADYKAINETPGVSPGLRLKDPETAATVRVRDGETLTDGPGTPRKEATITAAAEFVVEAGVTRRRLDEGARDALGERVRALARLTAGSG